MSNSGGGLPAAAGPPIYREVQRFRHWYFYVPIIVVVAVVWWQFIQQVVLGRPMGESPIPDWAATILTVVFGLGFPIFAFVVKMVTEVRPGNLSVGLFPFKRRRIELDAIKSAEVREYSPMREFGGWGVRYSFKSGRAYNAYGTEGVQLVMRDDSRILIGSQRSEELLNALRSAGARA